MGIYSFPCPWTSAFQVLLTALSYTAVYGDPIPDAQFYGGSLHHQYGGGQPYQYQQHFVADKAQDTPADTVKLVAADQKIPAAAVFPARAGHRLPYGYAGGFGYAGYEAYRSNRQIGEF